MPNPHTRKLFEDALAEVQLNDKNLTEAYAVADRSNFSQKELVEFFEILGGLAAGAAIAAPAIATGVGMYRKAKKEEQARQDVLNKEKEDRATEERRAAEKIEQNRLGREHTTSERQAGQDFTKGESAEERRFRENMAASDRGFKSAESDKERGFKAGESQKDRDFTSGQSKEERNFRRGERLGTQRHQTGMSREQILARTALELAKRGAKIRRKKKGKKGTP
jgi:hypothetical protein